MFSVILLDFAKKENSTKQPTGGGLAVQGVLKEPCSIANPRIRIERMANDASPSSYTYAYINTFGRYYFIKDWVWTDGLWEVDMEVDVLASFKTQIGQQSEYVLRTDSTTSDYNGAISDSAYPATTDFSISRVVFDNPFATDGIGGGTYIVGIISGDSANAVGAITYYAMTSAQFGALKSYLFSQPALEKMGLMELAGQVLTWKAEDMSEEIFKTMYNPYQYIASCMWFPINISDVPAGSAGPIQFGWWTFSGEDGISGSKLTQTIGNFHDSVETLPVHPQASTRGKYLNYSPYSKYTLHGKFGSLPLDTAFFEVGSYIVNTYSVDYVSGQCLFQVFVSGNSSGTGRSLITKSEFMIGVPIQLAQIGRDYLGTAVSALDAGRATISGALAGSVGGLGGAIIGGLSAGAGGIYNTIDASMPQLQTSGINGSYIEIELATILIAIHFVVVDEDVHHMGRPLCEVRQLNTLTGYVLCSEGDIDISCYDAEKTKIRNYLTTGFFWE